MVAGAFVALSVGAALGHVPQDPGETIPDTGLRQSRGAVLGNGVVIAPPEGYCVDDRATRSEDPTAALVLLASCRALTGNPDAPTPRWPGLLTASIGEQMDVAATPSGPELQQFFRSERGRAALAWSGDPEAVTLGDSYLRDGLFLIHAREAGGGMILGGQSWRAVFLVNGRLVTATLRELGDHPIGAADGFGIVEGFAREIRAASH